MAERFMRRSRRYLVSPLTVVLVMMLVAVAPDQAYGPQAAQAGQTAPAQGAPGQAGPGQPIKLPVELFQVPDGFESHGVGDRRRMLYNPTNIDIDTDGRIWVAEGVRYRSHHARQPEGDRIVVLQDTDGDGKADSTHTFVQEPGLIAPLGVSVIDNKIVVSQPPDLIVYTDVDRNLTFDPAVDKREVLLTGFQGINHDHSLHSVTVGPDGKWIFNSGNIGGMFTDRSGKTFRIFGSYRPGPVGPFKYPHDPADYRRQAERRRARVRRRVHGADESRRHQRRDHRPQLSQQLRAVGHLARRRVPERQRRPAGLPRRLGDGIRQLRLLVERRPADVAGGPPAGPDDAGGRVAPGRSRHDAGRRRLRRRIADRQCVLRERRARRRVGRDLLRGRAGAQRDLLLSAGTAGRGLQSRPQDLHDLEREAAVCRLGLHRRQRDGQGRARNAVPAVGRRRRPRRRALRQRLDRPARRRAPGSRRDDVRRDLPHRAEGVHLESADLRRVDDRRA